MLKKALLFLSFVLLLASCSSGYPDKLKISATTWIGYTPLFYAKERGWLEPLNIKVLNVSSLSENMYLYQSGNADAYVGTQYEYSLIIKKDPSLMPIIMFDRSYGGDVIMGNRSIEDLQSASGEIDAYLEMDSINITLLNDFIHKYALQDKKINYINKDQAYISTLHADNMKKETLIVTYSPYNNDLNRYGFKELASTKDGLELLVIDALFTTEKIFYKHHKQFLELKKLVDKAVLALQKDPKEFYETVKPYMLEISYEEFLHSLSDIVWINKEISPELKERMKEANFPTRDLI